MFIPGALHGIEASFLADSSLRKQRTAIFRVVWSSRQPLANTGAVLSLLDGPSGCDLAFCVVWFRFRLLRRYLAYRPRRFLGCIGCLTALQRAALGTALRIGSLIVLRDSRQLGHGTAWAPCVEQLGWPYSAFWSCGFGGLEE